MLTRSEGNFDKNNDFRTGRQGGTSLQPGGAACALDTHYLHPVFFSGFPALIYQLTWQRALFRIFGVNMESVTIVVTAFMLGLGLGSLAGGWLSKRRGIALLPLLAAIELLTAAFGVLSLDIFQRVGELVMLPILVGHLVRRSGNVGGAVGLLYYVNTPAAKARRKGRAGHARRGSDSR